MTRTELVHAMSERAGITRDQADAALTALESALGEALAAGDPVKLPGFLSFERTTRAARTGRNPQTGETIQIPEGQSVKVSVGNRFKRVATASN